MIHYKPWLPTGVELVVILTIAVVLAASSTPLFLPWWGASALWLAPFAVLITASVIRIALISRLRRPQKRQPSHSHGLTLCEVVVAAAFVTALGLVAANMFVSPVAVSHGRPVVPCLLIPFAPHQWMVFGIPVC